jgi:hypothetical protein
MVVNEQSRLCYSRPVTSSHTRQVQYGRHVIMRYYVSMSVISLYHRRTAPTWALLLLSLTKDVQNAVEVFFWRRWLCVPGTLLSEKSACCLRVEYSYVSYESNNTPWLFPCMVLINCYVQWWHNVLPAWWNVKLKLSPCTPWRHMGK